MPHASNEPETKFKGVLEGFGLRGWTLVWEPDSTQPNRGRILPEVKVILIHDKEPEAAIRTVLHEIVELKLRPAFNLERSLSNALIEWANTQAYQAKERSIENLLDIIFSLAERSEELREILEEARTV